ncbi:SGNH hydrolase [Westerdykella ornata]|uniref:SGNH hydrolase n=1 Tax=Westerdykella ornata TaxID=318751 RepID=A0A6A6JAK3_WESOR|nr:SGNH hydrolase [Westerdykella ornata]KAF2272998.1 SGNH hydrolase [Westerdykella ornata]
MKFISFAAALTVVGQASATVRIMPFGASIVTPIPSTLFPIIFPSTHNHPTPISLLSSFLPPPQPPPQYQTNTSQECWRALLYRNLTTTGYPNIDFVGNAPTKKDCGFPFDSDHEGRPGALAIEYVEKNWLPDILANARPDVVVMHLGTNDMVQNKKIPDVLAAYSTLVDQMRASKPNMQIIFSQLIPMRPDMFNGANARITELNKAIATWAPQKSTQRSPIIVVDNNSGFNVTTDTYDGEHPNDSGNRKLSAVFYKELARIIPAVS